MDLTVIIPAHNPDPARLRRVLEGLRTQTLERRRWEILLVDNASRPPVDPALPPDWAGPPLRVVREGQVGLTAARRRGFIEAQGGHFVLVDDDNVLAPDYLDSVLRRFADHPEIGAVGGRILPEFERAPNDWQSAFLSLLTVRDLGDTPAISRGLRPPGSERNVYPTEAAPVGAGMALRRQVAEHWLAHAPKVVVSDRRGTELTSAGDNDIVFAVMGGGFAVAYFPELKLIHLIPAARLEADYLARLNRGIQRSWMQVLTLHQANPWPTIPGWTVPLRKLKSWFSLRAWAGPAARIRWQGACGHFEGRISREGAHPR